MHLRRLTWTLPTQLQLRNSPPHNSVCSSFDRQWSLYCFIQRRLLSESGGVDNHLHLIVAHDYALPDGRATQRIWSAPAERSGDGALDEPREKTITETKAVSR